MSYPLPIYPPISAIIARTDAESSGAAADRDEMSESESFYLAISDASISANRAQPDPVLPTISPLCSMFETIPSLRSYISFGHAEFTNTAENYINSPTTAIEQSHSALISAEKASNLIATSSSLLNLAPVDESSVSSPPASSHISSSQSSFSELQNSKNQMLDPPDFSPKLDIPEPSPTNDFDLSSSPPNSNPARIFSSSPFVSSQSSLPASDEPVKVDVPTEHHQPTTESVDEYQPDTPQSSPHHLTLSSPTLQSVSPQELLESSSFRSHSPAPDLVSTLLEAEIKLEALQGEQADETGINQEMQILESPVSNDGVTEKKEPTPAKRIKLTPTLTNPPPPTQKRPSFASQKLQHKKLVTPFRSPLMKKTVSSENNLPISLVNNSKAAELAMKVLELKPETGHTKQPPAAFPTMPSTTSIPIKKPNKFTLKAASQFKSPLSASAPTAFSSIRLTPTIQALERKVQILKRAVKVKMDGEEEELEKLIKKWTEAGREVAWEVWGLVKDLGADVGGIDAGRNGWGEEKRGEAKRGFEEGWGWDEKDAKKVKMDDGLERNRGWDVERDEDREQAGYGENGYGGGRLKNGMYIGKKYEAEEEEKREDTLGTMLRQLGIAPETFGWNEDEGEFVGG